jgi:hypothetical protein
MYQPKEGQNIGILGENSTVRTNYLEISDL